MSNELVGYSRAGDVFHYLWAARRSLELIAPNSTLDAVVIEGSTERKKAGEYVIDVSEYYKSDEEKSIKYYQLKHSTVRTDSAFTISDFKGVINGFAKRFIQHHGNEVPPKDGACISFTIITNRKIDRTLKDNFCKLAHNENVTPQFRKSIEKYTTLRGNMLAEFCGIFHFEDGHGDFKAQKEELRVEIAQLLAGSVDNELIDTIVALIQEKVLPNANNVVRKEDILKRFGITSERELFPAPPAWDKLDSIITRDIYNSLKKEISKHPDPTIIHAAGGVGKSVFCRHFAANIETGSLAIAYDCFGAGTYRSRSTPRHKHKDALVQMANELAAKGLCKPLIAVNDSREEDIMRMFLICINNGLQSLKRANSSAKLYILVDAADNAEMAAKNDFNQACFASELLAEQLPPDCRVIMFCRSERIQWLRPRSNVRCLELQPFSSGESLANLKTKFPDSTERDGEEFHRLTSGNPRVQANELHQMSSTVHDLLNGLGNSGKTVEDQIKMQLQKAVGRIKDLIPNDLNQHVDEICLGLANLPPHIPIVVLAQAASVKPEFVKSFVADIGRALWLADSSIQFRDEPTETWFRETFSARKADFEKYLEKLEPLAEDNTYVAETLPQLYLQAQQYSKLIEIALSDRNLPKENPIDRRNIRVYRLQFAFKAALKKGNIKDAVMLAMRAGEEVAGNVRQEELMRNNVDLLVALQSPEKIQETVFRRKLKGAWHGSENVYAASLLSSIPEYRGEARMFLRSALNWFDIYVDEFHDKRKNNQNLTFDIDDQELVEFVFSLLNLEGVDKSLLFFKRLRSGGVFKIMRHLTSRLVEQKKFSVIDQFLSKSLNDPYKYLAISSELMKIGLIANLKSVKKCLNLLINKKTRVDPTIISGFEDRITPSIIDLLEASMFHGLPANQILELVQHYIPLRTSQMFASEYDSKERTLYLRGLAIRMQLQDVVEVNYDNIIPEVLLKEAKKSTINNDASKYKEILSGLIPWFLLRIKAITIQITDMGSELQNARNKSQAAFRTNYYREHSLEKEIARVQASILIFHKNASQNEIQSAYNSYIKNNHSFTILTRIETLRAASFLPHLSDIRAEIEQDAANSVNRAVNDGPQELSGNYIGLSRAVLAHSVQDSSVYFEEAVNIVSKFGDEIYDRWVAISALAKTATLEGPYSEEVGYRFIRCAETVGENMREKHWSRSEAIINSARLFPGAGISALSRWRDRDIGYFDRMLEALLEDLVLSEKIDVSAAWALTRLLPHHYLNELISACLNTNCSHAVKQYILDDAVRLLQIEGAPISYWKKLREIVTSKNLSSQILNKICDLHATIEKKEAATEIAKHRRRDTMKWQNIFLDSDCTTVEGLQAAYEKLQLQVKAGSYDSQVIFWNEVLKRVEENDIFKVIDAALSAKFVDFYDIQELFKAIPVPWRNKVSFAKRWPKIAQDIGERYAFDLIDHRSVKSFATNLEMDHTYIPNLLEGIIARLATDAEFNQASVFFGFVSIMGNNLNTKDARDSLEFSLERFELHVDNDFGDGKWNTWLQTGDDMPNNVAGFIWSALGSPVAAMRWSAVHVVKVLAELGNAEIIDGLIQWLLTQKVGAFGSNEFPFYNLHARLYLFIALARVSMDDTSLLKRHSTIFSKYALEPHTLIQNFCVDIAINIERDSPGTYSAQLMEKMKWAVKSDKPTKKIEWGKVVDTIWHAANVVQPSNFHFGWDFDRYWFEPLGDVFGVSGKQIEDLAARVITEDWGLKEDQSGYYKDPRSTLWNRSGERETRHDHGSYPRTDNLDFYHSYHSMFVVSAKLLENMPIVTSRDEEGDPWENWLSYHLLSRENGKWLAELRDPVPLTRPTWVQAEKSESWLRRISEQDFFDSLVPDVKGNIWLNISGGWHEIDNDRKETYTVNVSLVDSESSNALMNAINTCNDPYDYYLPQYEGEDEEDEENDSPFVLRGLFRNIHRSKELDDFDPYSNNIDFPPTILGDMVREKLNITVSEDEKLWYSPISDLPSLICEMWRAPVDWRDKEPDQSGHRLRASLPFLLSLCATLKCDLIFEVGIKRSFIHHHRETNQEYVHPKRKIYILSSNGELRTAKKSYRLR
jgi:hypothetical protein